ncbi:uncharacterized protein LOC135842829 [Planococcus citri]|uniref:uncharacterized protein LOC135842829 n=1 Tax=Planococcus citri TaxID=170843 RepID=UPI0031F8D1F0
MFRCVVPKIQRAVLNSRVRFQSNNSADRNSLLSQIDLLTKQVEAAEANAELAKIGAILAKVREIITVADAKAAKAESDFVYDQLFGNNDQIDDDERAAVKKMLQEVDEKYYNSGTLQSSDTSPDRKEFLSPDRKKFLELLTNQLKAARAYAERAKADAILAQADAKVARAETETVYNQLFGNNDEFDDDERAAIKKKLQDLEENYIRNHNTKA